MAQSSSAKQEELMSKWEEGKMRQDSIGSHDQFCRTSGIKGRGWKICGDFVSHQRRPMCGGSWTSCGTGRVRWYRYDTYVCCERTYTIYDILFVAPAESILQ